MGKVILASAPIATAGSSMAASGTLSNVVSKGYIKAGYHVINTRLGTSSKISQVIAEAAEGIIKFIGNQTDITIFESLNSHGANSANKFYGRLHLQHMKK